MTFQGFRPPEQNWSKLPHAMIEALPLVETVGELKVILYILRHTWGYQEYDDPKKITLDEFENGRRRRDRTRMDSGTGLSRPTIIDGLERAEKHGFIIVEYDESDSARVKKFYSIRTITADEGLRNFTPGVKELYPRGKETLPRSEKDTSETNLKKEGAGAQPLPTLPEEQPPQPDSDSLFEEMFGPDPAHEPHGFQAADLITEEGRERMQDAHHRAWQQQAQDKPWLEPAGCKQLGQYNPPTGVNREHVLRIIYELREAGVILDTGKPATVRFWISEAEACLRMANGKVGTVLAALEQSLQDGMTLKSPKSIQYAISAISQQQARVTQDRDVVGEPGGIQMHMERIELPPEHFGGAVAEYGEEGDENN